MICIKSALVISFLALVTSRFAIAQQPKNSPDVNKLAHAVADEMERRLMIEDAQKKFSTTAGHEYVEKFAKSVAKSLIDAMHACDEADFKSDFAHDIVFVVAADGHIERVLQSPAKSIRSVHRRALPTTEERPETAS